MTEREVLEMFYRTEEKTNNVLDDLEMVKDTSFASDLLDPMKEALFDIRDRYKEMIVFNYAINRFGGYISTSEEFNNAIKSMMVMVNRIDALYA